MSKRSGTARSVPAVDPRTVTASMSIEPELLEEVNAAAAACFRNNRSFLIAEALREFLEHLRRTRNGGKPFAHPDIPPAGRRNRRAQ